MERGHPLNLFNFVFSQQYKILQTFEGSAGKLLNNCLSKMIYRVISSVGLEHYLDRVGVTGSNPVLPTLFLVSGVTGRLVFFDSLLVTPAI